MKQREGTAENSSSILENKALQQERTIWKQRGGIADNSSNILEQKVRSTNNQNNSAVKQEEQLVQRVPIETNQNIVPIMTTNHQKSIKNHSRRVLQSLPGPPESQESSKRGPRQPKRPPREPQGGPRELQESPKRAEENSKSGPREARRPPRDTQERPKEAQDLKKPAKTLCFFSYNSRRAYVCQQKYTNV